MSVVFSVLAAVTHGTSMFLTNMGLRSGRVPPLRAVMVNLSAANLLLWPAFFISLEFQPVALVWSGVAFFILAGLAAPLVGRYLGFQSIQRLGASRGSTLQLSEMLFAAPLAYLIFGQSVSHVSMVGIIVFIIGMGLFIKEVRSGVARRIPVEAVVADAEETVAGAPPAPTRGTAGADPGARRGTMSYATVGVISGLMAGLFFLFGNLFRLAGIEVIPSAVLGSAIGTLAALVVATAGAAGAGMPAYGEGRRGLLRGLGDHLEHGDALPLPGPRCGDPGRHRDHPQEHRAADHLRLGRHLPGEARTDHAPSDPAGSLGGLRAAMTTIGRLFEGMGAGRGGGTRYEGIQYSYPSWEGDL